MDLQRVLHPDMFSCKSEVGLLIYPYFILMFFNLQREKEFSSAQSALINKAYSTLSIPYKRGIYLVSLVRLCIIEKQVGLVINSLILLPPVHMR